jgi:hypothetical protein
LASSQSLLSLSSSHLLPPSADANAHGSSSVRGHDPPSVAAATRTSSIPPLSPLIVRILMVSTVPLLSSE